MKFLASEGRASSSLERYAERSRNYPNLARRATPPYGATNLHNLGCAQPSASKLGSALTCTRFETLDKLVTYMRLLERKAYALKDYFTVDEVADYLGVSKSRVYKMTSAHVIDYYKPSGKTIHVSRSDLNDWICGTRIASDEEIRTEAWRKAVRYNLDHPYVFNKLKRRTSG